MTITELIAQYRRESRDNADPPLVSNEELIVLYNEAIDQACTRKQLLFDATTADVCELDIDDTTAIYDLHESIVTPTMAYLIDSTGKHIPLKIVDRFEMDRINPVWRADAAGEPGYLIVDEKSVQLTPPPAAAHTLKMEVYRTPLATEKLPADPEDEPFTEEHTSSPVIAKGHHEHLVHWVLSRVYGYGDNELLAPGKAAKHESMFNRYFGLPPTADRMRSGMTNRPHRNKPW